VKPGRKCPPNSSSSGLLFAACSLAESGVQPMLARNAATRSVGWGATVHSRIPIDVMVFDCSTRRFHGRRGRGRYRRSRRVRSTVLRPFGWLSRGSNCAEPVGAAFVEPMNPVTQCLAVHAADPRCLLPIHAVENRGQRVEPSTLVGVPGSGGEPSQIRGREVRPKLHRSRYGANPPRAWNQGTGQPKRARETPSAAVGIRHLDTPNGAWLTKGCP
jgi:hypothetical protein